MKKIGPKMKKPAKTKGKTKASSHKASAGKIANKKTNKLAKQGKLNKETKKRKKKDRLNEKRQQEQNLLNNHETSLAQEENDDPTEENEDCLNEEDFKFLKRLQHAKDFIKADLGTEGQERKNKRKREVEEEEEEYEQQPRSFQTDKQAENMKMMLPIINKGKVIKRMAEKDVAMTKEDERVTTESNGDTANGEAEDVKEDKSDEEDHNPTEDEKTLLASLTPAQLFAYRRNKLEEKKRKLAHLSHCVIEDPENNMKKLKELRLMLGDTDAGVSVTIRKYAMVSLMEVFKDIVPGYRLRIPTDKEKTQKVKKETKSLWDYEASFLLSYRIYLEYLESTARGKPIPNKSFLTKHGVTNINLPSTSSMEFRKVALNCLCEMLVNHPHFNYRNNIISALVPLMNHNNKEFSTIACEAMKSVFVQDKTGEVTLEIVRNIGKMAKKLNFDMRPEVLRTFLVLKIKEIDLTPPEEKAKMKYKEKMMKLSRRERKRMKQREQLDKELLETKASVDKQRKLKLHTEIIQAVFESYIRVIKLASDSILLPAVLEGLAKFAHLINVEYFDSLFTSINKLIESGILTDLEMLHCLQTAFTILSGQGSVINFDPSRFYKHLYCTLPSIHFGSSSEMVPVVLQCLHTMINRRRKMISQQRILAFMKRLSTICLQQVPETTVSFLAAVRQFVHTYRYSDILFDTEAQGTGIYLPELEDPEHCCANNTSLWELHLLQHHYDPEVCRYSRHLLKSAPLAGEHQLPTELARKSPIELFETFSSKEIFDEKIPEKSPKKKKVRPSKTFLCPDFSSYLNEFVENAEIIDMDTR